MARQPARRAFRDGGMATGGIADSMSNVMIKHRARASVEGEKIAEGKRRLKIFLAVFTTL
jgi:hypothetical protein